MRAHKLICAVGLAAILISGSIALAQDSPVTKQEVVFDYKTDFAVPDAPAFRMLSPEGTEILRPTNVRDMALAVSDFLESDNSLTLPRRMAVEFSPGLLIGGRKLSVARYRKHPQLYGLRVSLATARSKTDNTSSALSVGIRGTGKDGSDLRLDTALVQAATTMTERITAYYESLTSPQVTLADVEQRPDVQLAVQEMRDEFRREVLEKWAHDHWNAGVIEYALAALFQSPDSTADKLEFRQVAVWGTWATGFDQWGQLLVGFRLGWAKPKAASDELKNNLTISSRLYIGTNTTKVFAESQFAAEEAQTGEALLNAGGETRLSSGLWIEFSAGALYSAATGRAKLVTDFRLKYGL